MCGSNIAINFTGQKIPETIWVYNNLDSFANLFIMD